MQDSEKRNHEMIWRVCDFHGAHADTFPPSSKGGELFASLAQVLREIEAGAEAKALHMSAAAQGTENRGAARETLRGMVEAINRTARAMSYDTPGLDKLFRLPQSNSDQALLLTARTYLTNAEPLKAEFIRNELPATFLEDLRALVSNFEQSITAHNRSVGARVSATKSVKAAIPRGVAIVRQLDAIVRNKFASDPAVLAEWASASHVERAARRPKSKPAPQSDAPPSQ